MSGILRSFTLLLALAASLFAADLNGKWTGILKSGNGDIDTTMVLKVSGEKLTGTVTNMYGEEEITEGTVKGDDLSFIILAGGGQFKLVYKGKVEADQIRFNVTVGDFGDFELIAKRAQ
ncbi:MAG TPA: hypothetical protein VER03_22700 [Bryobacteraceae bacterium]|nr:hypothetical protein [Bryobacteraceae bacterium]